MKKNDLEKRIEDVGHYDAMPGGMHIPTYREYLQEALKNENMNCNEYEDFRELTPLEQCMANHGYSEDDVIRILNALGDFSSIRTSEFNYEIENDIAYIEAKDGYTLVLKTGEDYVKIKAVKEKK